MSENNQNNEEIEISYSIYIKEFPEELIKILQEHNIKFQVWKNHTLKEEYYDSEEEVPLIDINLEIYKKLKKISEFIGEDLHEFSSNLLEKTIESFEMDPYQDLSFWLPTKKLLKKIFKSGEEYNDDTPEENENNKEETITISIPKELYNKVEALCKINNLDTNDKIIDILGTTVLSAEIDEEAGHKHVFNF